MQIQLLEIIPTYFEKSVITESEIWGRKVVFNQGEHVHIIAPSGSGKTSLIHFIYGMRKDYEGRILYDETNIRDLTLETFSTYRQKNISIIFQDLRLFADQTVRNNLELKRQLNPYHPPQKIDEMAMALGIQDKLGRTARTCSYGEQQRIAIIRSLLQPFNFILLDEPFSHLDDANRLKAFELIKSECELRNASMLFADLKELEFFTNEKRLRL
ncbi:MAG: ATP-binding cassette domain-containing protein [Chitinophagaceae bacterium]|nr:ATP-binding cassette domain-containing protein [Chitinophagaceae bacterium]